MARLLPALVPVLAALACATPEARRAPAQLYLSVEVRRGDALLGAPKVLGYEGRSVTIEKDVPGRGRAFRLVMTPRQHQGRYRVGLDVESMGESAHGEVGLLHGQERRVRLGVDTELRLLVLEVGSPEFDAWMRHARSPGPGVI